ncbi:MAG: LysE family translocator [Chloroflexota bacterium]
MDVIDARFGAYLAVVALLIVTPGPDVALVTRNALLSGYRAASCTAGGVAIGIFVWALASILGVAVLLQSSAVAFNALKLAGAAYLVYFGIRSLMRSFTQEAPSAPADPANRPDRLDDWQALRQGILGNLLNPKAGVIFVSIVPQFIKPGDSPVRLTLMLLAFELMLLIWLNGYGYLMSRAGRSRAGVKVRRTMERITGVVLIGLGARLAFEHR